MKRTPIVVTATVAGLAGVLAFHTSPAEIKLAPSTGTAGPQASQTGQGGITADHATESPSPSSSSSSKSKSASKPRSASKPKPTASGQGGTRTVDGPSVNYSYGVLSVSVTVSGDKIVKVGIASLNDDGNFRSEMIDQQSIPILEQEAMQAQSSNIQSVSGASYTSAGFRTSLQAALRSVGFS
jgi:uncharacterized protein with FMN-binding domain